MAAACAGRSVGCCCGARPLKRAIQRELQDPLAMRILAGDFRPGDVIHVDRSQAGLEFTAGEPVVDHVQHDLAT